MSSSTNIWCLLREGSFSSSTFQKKSHKYGVKLFKICDPTEYTYRIMIDMGRGTGGNDGISVTQSVVVDLMRGYLDAGRVVYLDNYYTSMHLGITLLNRSTHMVGTVTSNRSWFPHKKLVNDCGKHLEKGEMNCLEYPSIYSRTKAQYLLDGWIRERFAWFQHNILPSLSKPEPHQERERL